MGVDHRDDWLLRAVLVVQVERGARGFGSEQRVDDDQAGVAFHNRHVGQVEAAHLVDAPGHAVQAVVQVELRLAPQARVDRGRRGIVLQEGVGVEVPDDAAAGVADLAALEGADKAAAGVLEILPVGEGQALEHLGVGLARGRGGIARG
ncbi:hypothetical protein D9M68_549300 [compost metagenome]